MRAIFILTGIMFLSVAALAAGITSTRAKMIRNSPDYRCGEGYGATMEEARSNAASSLATGILALIQTAGTNSQIETTDELKNTYTQITKLQSTLQLQGLEYLDLGMVEERHHVLAYITLENLAASNQRQKDRIRALLEQAEQARQQADIGMAARDAYWAYLLAHTVLDTLRLDLPTGKTDDPKFDLLNYLQTMLSDLQFTAKPAMKRGTRLLVPVSVSYDGKPVKSLALSYYGGVGTEYAYVVSGFCDLELYLPLPYPSEYAIKPHVEYADEGSMVHYPDIEALHGVLRKQDIPASWCDLVIRIPGGREEQKPAPVPKKSRPPRITVKSQDTHKRTFWPMPITVLADIRETPKFLEAVQVFVRNGRLSLDRNGPGPLRGAGLDVYVAVADSEEVKALFHCEEDDYVDVRRNIRVSDLSKDYTGAYQIWIGIPK